MKHINHSGKANSVDGPVCIAVFIIDNLQHASAAKTLQRLGTRVFIAILRIVDRKTHDAANLVRESPQIVSRRSYPYGWLLRRHASLKEYSSTAIFFQVVARKSHSNSSFRDAPPELGFTRVRLFHLSKSSFVQVGNSRPGWRGPGIHSTMCSVVKWIPGSTLARRPGMTMERRCKASACEKTDLT